MLTTPAVEHGCACDNQACSHILGNKSFSFLCQASFVCVSVVAQGLRLTKILVNTTSVEYPGRFGRLRHTIAMPTTNDNLTCDSACAVNVLLSLHVMTICGMCMHGRLATTLSTCTIYLDAKLHQPQSTLDSLNNASKEGVCFCIPIALTPMHNLTIGTLQGALPW